MFGSLETAFGCLGFANSVVKTVEQVALRDPTATGVPNASTSLLGVRPKATVARANFAGSDLGRCSLLKRSAPRRFSKHLGLPSKFSRPAPTKRRIPPWELQRVRPPPRSGGLIYRKPLNGSVCLSRITIRTAIPGRPRFSQVSRTTFAYFAGQRRIHDVHLPTRDGMLGFAEPTKAIPLVRHQQGRVVPIFAQGERRLMPRSR